MNNGAFLPGDKGVVNDGPSEKPPHKPGLADQLFAGTRPTLRGEVSNGSRTIEHDPPKNGPKIFPHLYPREG